MKTLITVPNPFLRKIIFSDTAIKRLQALSEITWTEEGRKYTSEELAQIIPPYDACITGWGSVKFTQEVVEKAAKLKFIGHTAGTVVPVVDECVFDKGITVVNANDPLARSTAELAVALMMNGAWNIHGYNVGMKQGVWSFNNKETVMGLYGQVIGLIGMGDISREVIRLLKPYHARILMHSSYCSPEEAQALGVELCSLEELLKNSQIVSLHNTLTPSTKGMLGQKELAMLKDGALIVNTARAPIIDQEALLEELKTGRIFAAIDVFEKEPIDREDELLKLPNVICTPHIGGFSRYWKTRLGETAVEELERYLQGQPLRYEVTLEKFRRQTPK